MVQEHAVLRIDTRAAERLARNVKGPRKVERRTEDKQEPRNVVSDRVNRLSFVGAASSEASDSPEVEER